MFYLADYFSTLKRPIHTEQERTVEPIANGQRR